MGCSGWYNIREVIPVTNEALSMKTKMALADALKKLMTYKPLTKITVNELSSVCNVNRNTFYYHFTDIYMLLQWTMEQETIAVVKQMDLLSNTEEAIAFVMDWVQENRKVLLSAYESVGHKVLKDMFYQELCGVVHKAIIQGEETLNCSLDEELRMFAVAFYTDGLVGTMLTWVCDPNGQDKESLRKNILDVCQITIPALIRTKGK